MFLALVGRGLRLAGSFLPLVALSTCSVPAFAQITSLSFRPLAIEYSSSLDRIVMVAGSPNQLHIYDPNTKSDVAVNLPLTPMSVSVSPDGLYAAVGHEHNLSYVSLAAGRLIRNYTVSKRVTGLVLGSQYAYALPDVTINLATGAELWTSTSPSGPNGRLHPNQKWIYNTRNTTPDDIQRFDIIRGSAEFQYDSIYHGEFSICGEIWFSQDGERVFNSCATAFQVSAEKEKDLVYFGRLSRSTGILSLSHSAARNKILVISQTMNDPAFRPTTDSEIQVYDYDYLSYAGRLVLPRFATSTGSFAAHGKFVTYSADSSKVYAVLQADPSSGLQNDFGVSVIEWQPASNCNLSFSANSVSPGSAASAATLQVSATNNCAWEATRNQWWISFPDGRYGLGSAALPYRVAENASSAGRAGAIHAGGVRLSISQPASSASAERLVRLPFSPDAAEYSRPFDSIVAVSKSANELYIYNPQTHVSRVVPLILPGSSVSLSASGLLAAVGHDGWVSHVDVASGAVQRLYKVPVVVDKLVLGEQGHMYLFPEMTIHGSVYSVNLLSGATTEIKGFLFGGATADIHPSGKYLYENGSAMHKHALSAAALPEIVWPTHEASGCGRIWFFPDGARMLTACGEVRISSEIRQQDMAYDGVLSGHSRQNVGAASYSASRKLLAVIHRSSSNPGEQGSLVSYYNGDTLGYRGDDAIPAFLVNGTNYEAKGRWLFWSADSSRLFVLAQADPRAQLIADSGVYTTIPNDAPVCSYTVASDGTAFPTAGGVGAMTVSTTSACSWYAKSDALWILVPDGSTVTGAGKVSFSVIVNHDTEPRTGNLIIAGQIVTITQTGPPPPTAPGVVELGSFYPLNGSGSAETFSGVFTHSSGVAQLYLGYALFLPTPNIVWFTAKGSCLVEYNRISNGIRLINDAGNNWLGPVSGVPITPYAGRLANAMCSVDVSKANVKFDSHSMTVQLPVTFKGSLTPVLSTFLQALDVNGKWTDMRQFGNWVVPAATPRPGVSIVGASPSYAVGSSVMYSVQVQHSTDINRLAQVHLRMNNGIVGGAPCHAIYFPLTNTLNLINSEGTGLVDPEGKTPGSTGTLSNSHCSIDSSGAARATIGNTLTINVPISLRVREFRGEKQVYVNAFDTTGALTHWGQVGTFYAK